MSFAVPRCFLPGNETCSGSNVFDAGTIPGKKDRVTTTAIPVRNWERRLAAKYKFDNASVLINSHKRSGRFLCMKSIENRKIIV